MQTNHHELVYDWNNHRSEQLKINAPGVKIHDESLRDGAQAANISRLALENQLEVLRLMNCIGIDRANVGFPISSEIQFKDIEHICQVYQKEKWQMELMCAARAKQSDVQSIVDISQKTSTRIWAGIFLASSQIRAQVMGWDLKEMAKMIVNPIKLAKENNLPVMFVTEDTSRSHPENVRFYNQIAIDNGVNQVCVTDTVGFATPEGTKDLIQFVKKEIIKNQQIDGKPIEVGWHGHNHRGFAWANTWQAILSGVDWVEGTLLGVGEMCGNCPTEDILLNCHLENRKQIDVGLINQLIVQYAKSAGLEIPDYWRVSGQYAYATGSGVHADAILKALEQGDEALAGRVYSAYDPRILGREIDAFIGQMSGEASVKLFLMKRGIEVQDPAILTQILGMAKSFRQSLSEKQLLDLLNHRQNS